MIGRKKRIVVVVVVVTAVAVMEEGIGKGEEDFAVLFGKSVDHLGIGEGAGFANVEQGTFGEDAGASSNVAGGEHALAFVWRLSDKVESLAHCNGSWCCEGRWGEERMCMLVGPKEKKRGTVFLDF